MRAFAFFMLTGGLLATASAPVFAAQIVETLRSVSRATRTSIL